MAGDKIHKEHPYIVDTFYITDICQVLRVLVNTSKLKTPILIPQSCPY